MTDYIELQRQLQGAETRAAHALQETIARGAQLGPRPSAREMINLHETIAQQARHLADAADAVILALHQQVADYAAEQARIRNR